MKMKDDFLIVNKYFIELHIVHFGPIPFAIFLAVALFNAHKIFILCWEKLIQVIFYLLIWSKGFTVKKYLLRPEQIKIIITRSEEYGGCDSKSHSSCTDFAELVNLYEVSHCLGGTLHLFYWSILVFSVYISMRIK